MLLHKRQLSIEYAYLVLDKMSKYIVTYLCPYLTSQKGPS